MDVLETSMAMSTPVSFSSGMSESFSYHPSSVTSYDSYSSIIPTPDASIGYLTDEPTSPLSHTGGIFDMHDLTQNSPLLERSLSGFESNINFDGPTVSVVDTVMPVLPISLNLPDGDSLGHNQAAHIQNHMLTTQGTSTVNSRPSTRNSLSFASTASSQTSLNMNDNAVPPAEDSMEESMPPSPTSSSSQTEGRTHQWYERSVGPDGMFHCPLEGTECSFPAKQLKCEYHKHIDSHLKPFKCRHKDCINQCFSSEACRLRHEREMHKMHNAKEHLCRYSGYCERKQPGNGFPRSFNRGDHERRVHGMEPDNSRTKGRLKNTSTTDNASISQTPRKPNLPQHSSYPGLTNSDDSSTSTISSPVAPRTGHPAPQNFGLRGTAPVPIRAPNYGRPPFMASASLPSGGPFGGPAGRSVPPLSTVAPLPRRMSAGPTGIVKCPRKGRASPVSSKVYEYTQHRDQLQKLVARLPEIPDEASRLLENTIAQELALLRHIHGDMELSTGLGP